MSRRCEDAPCCGCCGVNDEVLHPEDLEEVEHFDWRDRDDFGNEFGDGPDVGHDDMEDREHPYGDERDGYEDSWLDSSYEE